MMDADRNERVAYRGGCGRARLTDGGEQQKRNEERRAAHHKRSACPNKRVLRFAVIKTVSH